MTRVELRTNVRQWVTTHKQLEGDAAELSDETDLIGSGLLDSFDFVQLLAFTEKLAGREVDLSDIDVESFTTLGGFCAHVAAQMEPLTPSV